MMILSASMPQMVLVVGMGGEGHRSNRAGGQQQQQQSMAEVGECWTCLILLLLLQHRVLEGQGAPQTGQDLYSSSCCRLWKAC
jgi:hypothetical protein